MGFTENCFACSEEKSDGLARKSIIRKATVALFGWALVLLPTRTAGLVNANGSCPIYAFAPFSTADGQAVTGLSSTSSGYNPNETNVGFSQMAAAFMAVKQFNERDASVVPQLNNPYIKFDCKVQLELGNTSVFDTVSGSHLATQSLYGTGEWPCASVGPSSDLVAEELSYLAQAALFPLVVSRSYNLRIVNNDTSSYSSSIYPDVISSANALTSYIMYMERDYIGILYSTTDTGLQRFQSLSAGLDENGITWMSSGYLANAESETVTFSQQLSPLQALREIRDSGFYTVVIAMDDNVEDAFLSIADAAEELGMNDGQYLYFWYDLTGPVYMWNNNTNTTKLTNGSSLVIPYSLNTTSPFQESWRRQGQELVDQINAANPKKKGEVGYVHAEPDFFQTVAPGSVTAFMYDSVMAVGLGACHAVPESNGSITGANHQLGILNLSFVGATADVIFGTYHQGNRNSRLLQTITWGSLNIINGTWELADISFPNTHLAWVHVNDFVYADNTTVAPSPLRAPGDQNYLPSELRIFGLTIMSLTALAAIAFMIWVCRHRDAPVLKQSGPLYMQVVCFGVIVFVFAIFSLSFDEGAGWSQSQLDGACASIPWLIFGGYGLQHAGQFLMLWSASPRTISFGDRVEVSMKFFFWLVAVVWVAILILLSVWTRHNPLRWSRSWRTEEDEVTNSSYGKCSDDDFDNFALSAFLLSLATVVITAVVAQKTKEEVKENWWLFLLFLVQLEAAVIAAPVVVILNNQASTGTLYLGYVLILWVLSTSSLLILAVPKIVMHVRHERGLHLRRTPKRGEFGGVRVTGIVHPRPGESSADVTASGMSNISQFGVSMSG